MPDAQNVWWALRGLRANPPGWAGLPARRLTFGTALEQCEQLFAASKSVGYAARPLTLFYALSQAGRAVAAAFEMDDARWRLRGHGIGASDLDADRLWDVELVGQRNGSFVQVAHLLGSPSLPEPTRLGDVWAAMPTHLSRLPPDAHSVRALQVQREVMRGQQEFGGPEVYSEAIQLSPAWLYGLDPAIEFDDDPRRALDEHLARFPTLQGYKHPLPDDRPPQFHPTAVAGELGVRLMWDADGMLEAHREERIRRMCAPTTDGSLWVSPAIAGNEGPLHPLMAWWAVLFTLSMLARYEPAAWTQHRDIDASTDAIAVEALLDEALVEVPAAILAVLKHTTPS